MDDDTITVASAQGFELEERACRGEWVWGWCRGDDTRFPGYLTREEAVRWMADRLERVQVFA